jgi:hypothetical protein
MRTAPRPRSRVLHAVLACALACVVASPTNDVSAASPDKKSPVAKSDKKKKKKGKDKDKKAKTVAQKKAPPPPPPLDGTSVDYDYDGRDVGRPERRWLGRAFVHKKAAALAGQALPVLVFLHGNNGEAIKHRWMGGGNEGDVRRMASEMMESGMIPPIIVAAPSSIDPNTMTNAGAAWPAFDLDLFLDKTADRLGSAAVLDRGRVIVAAHSGGGCNIRGGLNTAAHAKSTPVLAAFSIDTCMLLDLAKELAHVRPSTHVVVSWQSISWPEREFGGFKTVFLKEVKKAPANPGVLRELDFEQPNVISPHDAMVNITLRKYLPRLLNPAVDTADASDAGAPAATADGG